MAVAAMHDLCMKAAGRNGSMQNWRNLEPMESKTSMVCTEHTLHRNTASSQLTSPMTPEMTMAPSALSGMCSNTGVSSSSVAPTRHAVKTPARPAAGENAQLKHWRLE